MLPSHPDSASPRDVRLRERIWQVELLATRGDLHDAQDSLTRLYPEATYYPLLRWEADQVARRLAG